MAKTSIHPLLGELSFQAGPDNLKIWKGEVMAIHQEKLSFHVMIHDSDDLDKTNLQLIAAVVKNPLFYINAARDFIQQQMQRNPVDFGLTQERSSIKLDDFLLSDPEFNFYEDDEWFLRFSECSLPLFEPYGLLVLFQRHQPVKWEAIPDPELLD